ncbi:hypothetical protein F5I97DRAFT_1119716 [Phlebopus sp. FC_14]|nr:hypothetical protein F5I97DRAFT_1119716 [Phlebopus sp. FC_14]
MPAIRDHDPIHNDVDDDDGMPPLVDNPNSSMTFTFFTDMTPITALSADPTVPFETVWESALPASPVEFAEPPPPLETGLLPTFRGPAERVTAHGKKRDASYIPRPPNAFILFRSSFIRSQQVPEKVEGNHSTLSKIIGKYWKTLPREEREVWEAKALVAQAEHRKRYPDWRFRPGANALAKLKIKDGPEAPNRKRNSHGTRKARGDPASKKKKSGDERCSIIADLLVEGKTGLDLEDAVKRWEDSAGKEVGSRNTSKREDGKGSEGGDDKDGVAVANATRSQERSVSDATKDTPIAGTQEFARAGNDEPIPQTRSQTPDATPDNRFKVPLTAMFKRSLSAPATHPSPSEMVRSHGRQDSYGSIFANVTYGALDSPHSAASPPSFHAECHEEMVNAVLGESMGNLSPLVLPSVLREGVPARWNDPYNLLETAMGLPPTRECPELTYSLDSPSVSPIDQSLGAYGYSSTPTDFESNIPINYTQDTGNYRAYSPLKSWEDTTSYGQMPIYINNGFGGVAPVYDWCSINDNAYMGSPSALHHYGGDAGGFGISDTLRSHANGDYTPNVAY